MHTRPIYPVHYMMYQHDNITFEYPNICYSCLGNAQKSADEMAEAMVEGVLDFTQQTKPSSLKIVKFSIFQNSMLQTFIAVAKRTLPPEQKDGKGICIFRLNSFEYSSAKNIK